MPPHSFKAMADEELAGKVSSDPQAYDELMERYEAKLLRYIRRLAQLNVQDAEDILQDVFLKAYMRIEDFDCDLKFSSWIYRITHNAVISEYRKRSSRKGDIELEEAPLKALIDDISIPSEIDRSIAKDIVREALNALPIKERVPLELFYFEDKTVNEISDIIRKPIGTVGTLMSRGKKRLKNHLNRLYSNIQS